MPAVEWSPASIRQAGIVDSALLAPDREVLAVRLPADMAVRVQHIEPVIVRRASNGEIVGRWTAIRLGE